jgi:hypothetical protein
MLIWVAYNEVGFVPWYRGGAGTKRVSGGRSGAAKKGKGTGRGDEAPLLQHWYNTKPDKRIHILVPKYAREEKLGAQSSLSAAR